MLMGYNQERPTERNYQDFESKLVEGLKGLNIEGLSLLYHGSHLRKDKSYVPGRSDIDATLEFPDDVVIDKNNLSLCSKILFEAQKGNNIPFNVCITDATTSYDGRFNTYMGSFREYFKNEGKVIFGDDPRKKMSFEDEKSGDLTQLSFNLRKARSGLLNYVQNSENNYEAMLHSFNKTLDAVSGAPRQILRLIDGETRENRFAGNQLIQEIFSDVDIEPLDMIKVIYLDLSKLDALYLPENESERLQLWNSSVTAFEQIVRSYIQKYPKRQSE